MNANNPRLHALDNLRGVMMWLGILFHVSLLHISYTQNPLFWIDPQTTLAADLLVGFIHCFRMPVFFILAGFFAAMLLNKQGLAGMLRNRVHRIALPFGVFWLVLFPLTIASILLHLHKAYDGQWGVDLKLLPNSGPTASIDAIHMWFLWMLMWFYVFTACIAKLAQRFNNLQKVREAQMVRWMVLHPLAPVLLAIALVLTQADSPMGVLETNTSFTPPLAQWLHYSMFYLWGIGLFIHRHEAFDTLAQRCKPSLLASLLVFSLFLVLGSAHNQTPDRIAHATVWLAALYSLSSWLMCLTWIGYFLRYVNLRSPVLSYLARSSYWVYLVHYPITIFIGAAYYEWTATAGLKILVNVLLTTLVCVASYELMVRRTFVGVFLNGKKYS